MATSRTGGCAWSRARRRSRSWCIGLVLLLGACDLVPALSGPSRAVSDHVPIAVLQVSGTYLGGELEVRGHVWRIGLRRAGDDGAADPGGGVAADAQDGVGSSAGDAVVTGRLLEADGGVLVEVHRSVEGSGDPSGDAGDIAEPGAFGLHLGVGDPAAVAALQVEAGGDLHEERVDRTVDVEMGAVPSTLRDPVDVDLTTHGDPAQLRVEVHGAGTTGRAIPVHGGSLHLDPSRYGRGVTHVAALATDGLAADLAYKTVEIAVDFEEHLDIHLDREDAPIRVSAGEPYLILPVTVTHHTAPGEARMEHPPPWTVTFTSDVDGPLDALNLSAGHPELYVEVSDLSPGAHVITVRAEGEAMAAQRPVDVHIER